MRVIAIQCIPESNDKSPCEQTWHSSTRLCPVQKMDASVFGLMYECFLHGSDEDDYHWKPPSDILWAAVGIAVFCALVRQLQD